MTYLYIMHDQKQLNEAIILEHVHHLKQLKKKKDLSYAVLLQTILEGSLCSMRHQKKKHL